MNIPTHMCNTYKAYNTESRKFRSAVSCLKIQIMPYHVTESSIEEDGVKREVAHANIIWKKVWKYMKVKAAQSGPTFRTPWTIQSMEFSRSEYWSVPRILGSLSLLQGIFPTQGSNPGLLHCRQFLYSLSHHTSFIFPPVKFWISSPSLEGQFHSH